MLARRVRILNFDDSVVSQKKLIERLDCPEIVDFKEIGTSCRLWANKKTADRIKKSLNPEFKHSITFLGSGDYHHISGLLLEQFPEPITLIVFDYHPDWDILPPALGCGSWVTYALRNENVKKAVLLGVSSEDISSIRIQTGNLNSLKHDRVEIYPCAHKPTIVLLRRLPRNISVRVEKGPGCRTIFWRELKDKNPADFMLELIKNRISTKQVYVSIDKDCLQPDYALTNWEEGCVSLDELLTMLKLIRDNLDIVGLDITGDYSTPKVKGMVKSFFSRFDHPKDYSARAAHSAFISSVNERTNIKIMELFPR